MVPTVGLTIVFYRESFANPLITQLSFILLNVLGNPLLSCSEFTLEG